MAESKSFPSRPYLNWAMVVVSGYMIFEYAGLSDDGRAIPADYVLGAWVVMFVAWLATAIYRTWFR